MLNNQPTELQKLQAELNDTALALVRTQRQLDSANKQVQTITSLIMDSAKSRGVELKTVEDIKVFLDTFKTDSEEV